MDHPYRSLVVLPPDVGRVDLFLLGPRPSCPDRKRHQEPRIEVFLFLLFGKTEQR